MPDTSQIKEHMDVISSDRKTVGKVDHLDGADKIKLTKQRSARAPKQNRCRCDVALAARGSQLSGLRTPYCY
jgi:hypothetical protein